MFFFFLIYYQTLDLPHQMFCTKCARYSLDEIQCYLVSNRCTATTAIKPTTLEHRDADLQRRRQKQQFSITTNNRFN